MITQDRLKELLYYNKQLGIFVWINPRRGMCAGSIAGTVNNRGYVIIQIDRVCRSAHRLAFLYVNGCFPDQYVDHINGVRSDNSFNNLRIVSFVDNLKNKKKRITNSSGVTGLSLSKREGKWKAYINSNNKIIGLGTYSDFFEAVCARKSAELKYNYHPNHGRRA